MSVVRRSYHTWDSTGHTWTPIDAEGNAIVPPTNEFDIEEIKREIFEWAGRRVRMWWVLPERRYGELTLPDILRMLRENGRAVVVEQSSMGTYNCNTVLVCKPTRSIGEWCD